MKYVLQDISIINCLWSKIYSNAWLSILGLSNNTIGCSFGFKLLIKLNMKNFFDNVGLSIVIKALKCLKCSWYSRTTPLYTSLSNSFNEVFSSRTTNLRQSSSANTSHFRSSFLASHPWYHTITNSEVTSTFCSFSVPCTRKYLSHLRIQALGLITSSWGISTLDSVTDELIITRLHVGWCVFFHLRAWVEKEGFPVLLQPSAMSEQPS